MTLHDSVMHIIERLELPRKHTGLDTYDFITRILMRYHNAESGREKRERDLARDIYLNKMRMGLPLTDEEVKSMLNPNR